MLVRQLLSQALRGRLPSPHNVRSAACFARKESRSAFLILLPSVSRLMPFQRSFLPRPSGPLANINPRSRTAPVWLGPRDGRLRLSRNSSMFKVNSHFLNHRAFSELCCVSGVFYTGFHFPVPFYLDSPSFSFFPFWVSSLALFSLAPSVFLVTPPPLPFPLTVQLGSSPLLPLRRGSFLTEGMK